MIRCPMFGKAVSSGLTTKAIILGLDDDLSMPLKCPACLKLHNWRRRDAWVEKDGKTTEGQGVKIETESYRNFRLPAVPGTGAIRAAAGPWQDRPPLGPNRVEGSSIPIPDVTTFRAALETLLAP